MGHRAPLKPLTGKEKDYLDWFRTILIHSLDLSTLPPNIWTISKDGVCHCSVCPCLAPGSLGAGGVKPRTDLCTYNCSSDKCLRPRNSLVGRSGWERVTKHCFNLSHILQHQWYLHMWVPFSSSECEAFGAQKSKGGSFSLFLVFILSWPNGFLSREGNKGKYILVRLMCVPRMACGFLGAEAGFASAVPSSQ